MLYLKFLYLYYRILKFFGKDSEKIALKIIELHNKNLLKKKFAFPYDKILLLLPHCIQFSMCKIRVTFNPDNCVRCGKCDISDIVDYCKERNIPLHIATGGTMARKVIKETRPKAIVAVACYRDLIEGLIDVKKLPVIAVLNKIGKDGPCVNTSVDVNVLKNMIEFFHGTLS
jgi:hypothetical protein